MPLKRAPGALRPAPNHIAFLMEDVATRKVVSCIVTEDALRKLSGGGSSIACMQAVFERRGGEDCQQHVRRRSFSSRL